MNQLKQNSMKNIMFIIGLFVFIFTTSCTSTPKVSHYLKVSEDSINSLINQQKKDGGCISEIKDDGNIFVNDHWKRLLDSQRIYFCQLFSDYNDFNNRSGKVLVYYYSFVEKVGYSLNPNSSFSDKDGNVVVASFENNHFQNFSLVVFGKDVVME